MQKKGFLNNLRRVRRKAWIIDKAAAYTRPFIKPRCRILALAFLVLQGCCIIPIPTPLHDLQGGVGEISKADMEFLERGRTTREEVLVRFGQPEYILDNDRIFVYAWMATRGYFLFLDPPEGLLPYPRTYLVLLEFDENGRLKRFERKSAGDLADAIDEWTPPGSEKLKAFSLPNDIKVHSDGALAEISPLKVKVEDLVDERAVGRPKWIGNGFEHKNIYLTRTVSSLIREAIVAQWKAAGHSVVEDNQDITLTGKILEFKMKHGRWRRVGDLDVIIEAYVKNIDDRYITRSYQFHKVNWVKYHRTEDFTLRDVYYLAFINNVLHDLLKQIATDKDLASFVSGE